MNEKGNSAIESIVALFLVTLLISTVVKGVGIVDKHSPNWAMVDICVGQIQQKS